MRQKFSFSTVESWLLAGLIFTTPLNLFFKFAESSAYVHGLFVDYLLPKLYLSDFFLIALSLTFLWQQKKRWSLLKIKEWLKHHLLGILLIGGFTFSQAWAANPFSAWWFEGKLLLISLIGYSLLHHSPLWQMARTKWAVVTTLLFQSLLGLYQLVTQTNLLPYRYLGETNFGSFAGLATQIIQGREVILPYGTTAHPNVFAGVIVIYGFLAWKLCSSQPWIRILIASSMGILITLSFSASAQLALLGIIIYQLCSDRPLFHQPKKLFSLSLFILVIIPLILIPLNQLFPGSLSIHRRAVLNQAAIQLFVHQPFGVGLNNFTTQVETYLSSSEVVRFLQPVHHTILLILTETGVLGVLIALWLWHQLEDHQSWKSGIGQTLWLLTPILALDHYLWSLQTGQIITMLLLVAVLKYQEVE